MVQDVPKRARLVWMIISVFQLPMLQLDLPNERYATSILFLMTLLRPIKNIHLALSNPMQCSTLTLKRECFLLNLVLSLLPFNEVFLYVGIICGRQG